MYPPGRYRPAPNSEVVLKLRPYAVAIAAFVAAAMNIAVLAPADAAATDPVTNLQVSQVQVGQNLQVSATWAPNDTATSYHAAVIDQASTELAFTDVTGSAATISVPGGLTVGGQTYSVAVRSTAPAATVTTQSFQALTLDTTGPTGTFALDHTSRYLAVNLNTGSITANFRVTQSALADASDASAASITRAVVAGDGSSSRAWTGGTGITLTYKKAGTFTPHVLLTDKFGNVTDKSLGAIHVYTDTTKPKVKIITPAAPARIASWKVIRGTTSDIGSGVLQAACLVIEKRGTVWYLYNFTEKRWVKGYASMTRTLNSSKADAAAVFLPVTATGGWHTPAIRGLFRGTLHVEAKALDGGFNVGNAPKIPRALH
jgi:hypothetical protein